MPLSASSIRSRSKNRFKAAAESKSTSLSCPLVVHFDRKLLLAIAGGAQKEDRVAVLVTGLEVEKILAIPKVAQGTGELVATAASESLHEWNLVENTVAMSFDTTSANTGRLRGACVLLEQKLGKNLLWLACRHHVLEVVCGMSSRSCLVQHLILASHSFDVSKNIGPTLIKLIIRHAATRD